MDDDTPIDEDRETSGIEFDAYGIKGKLNPAANQADEPANWWGVLRQLNQTLMGFVVDVPGLVGDCVKGLRNLVRALGGVKTIPKDVKRIAQEAQDEAEREEARRASQIAVSDCDNIADETVIQVLQGLQAEGLHVEIIERPDGAIAIVVVRPEPEWRENARRIVGYVPSPDEVDPVV